MGKSPGKWIKNFFGKKPSKSIVDKKKASSSVNNKNENAEKGHISLTDSRENGEYTSNIHVNGTNAMVQTDILVGKTNSLVQVDSMDTGSATVSRPIVSEGSVEECATIKEWKAFYEPEGITRIQALIRGHLTRRQALATLHCTWGIVKLQSLVRGSISRKSTNFKTSAISYKSKVGLVDKSWASGNTFALKLVSSSISSKALGFEYEREEANSAWQWLDRWTASGFWKPTLQPKKLTDPKPHGGLFSAETGSGRMKRVIRKLNGSTTESGSILLGNPQSELERVKRNLRKVTGKPLPEISPAPQEIEYEKHQNAGTHSSDRSLDTAKPDPFTVAQKTESFEEVVEEKLKFSERRASFSGTKAELPENGSQHARKLPSYMAATQSAKAKHRGHTSARVESEEMDHAAFTRRHSLPTSLNGKIGSASPRTHRHVVSSAKSGNRSDRSLISSRDGKDKPVLVEWRR